MAANKRSFIMVTEKDWEKASEDQRGWWTYQTLQSLNDRLSFLERRPLYDKCMAFMGGVIGGFVGAALSKRLSAHKGALNTVFAVLIFVVAAYMLWRSAAAIWA